GRLVIRATLDCAVFPPGQVSDRPPRRVGGVPRGLGDPSGRPTRSRASLSRMWIPAQEGLPTLQNLNSR
ncbi:hypothetical protein PspLS_01113, partial [Pyricularia sp. CBS 133598]